MLITGVVAVGTLSATATGIAREFSSSPPVCGSRATIALQFKIQGFVHCQEKSSNRDRSVNAICSVKRTNFSEGEDLGAYLIQQGWAMARPEAPFEYHALEKIARQQSAGIWGFTIDGIQRKPKPLR
jgi:endonuclease YncB( thermonuclease family)